ncbi:nuclear pore complex protein Nup155-like [Paramacrobiotus metropolitanus]|uniref:nuclear pore complex protein Nup155-like n=1 Tax=Paramacrobiotus metropolitanus TaxID=2943436 RepID=UPI002445C771|nr:nuclear pore complex protein Nup155-like [Paramacrobiotus metropolitanus]XP_055333000.1 nuclear pore complex protein Nup155-like [Paramacrobiotus metropolitanus]
MYGWNPASHSTPLDRPLRTGSIGNLPRVSDLSAISGSPDRRTFSPIKTEPGTSLLLQSSSSSPLRSFGSSPHGSSLAAQVGANQLNQTISGHYVTARSPVSLLAPRSDDDMDHGFPMHMDNDSLEFPSFSNKDRVDLQQASLHLEECIKKDLAKADIADQLVATNAGLPQVPSASGSHPDDYVASDVPHFRVSQEFPVHDVITAEINANTSGFSSLGTFPELQMAWVALDTKLYVWPWKDPAKTTCIEYPEFVTAVGLLPTWSPDLMYLGAQYCIVAATLTEILFSKVTLTGVQHVIETRRFVLRASTNDQRLCKIQCTKQGRVFFGNVEGHVSELQNIKQTMFTKWLWFGPRLANCTLAVYERIACAVPGFHLLFRKEPVVQMILDDTRKILYTLRKDNNVDLYDLGIDGTSGVRHIHLSFQNIVNQALPLLRNVDRLQIKQIISIHPVDTWESARYAFFLLTSAGLRLYFAVSASGLGDRPREFLLGHIRFPPGHNPSTPVSQITTHLNLSNSYSLDGTVLMIAPDDREDQDNIISCSNDLHIYEEKYRESVSVMEVPYHIEHLSELPQHADDSLILRLRSLALNQLTSSRKHIIALTAKKCYILEKSYPVDIMEKMLRTHSPMSAPMREFIESMPPFHSCFLALHLACTTNSTEVQRLATKILRVYGGEPVFENQLPLNGRMVQQPSQTATSPIIFSAKHDAFFYLVGRILGPLWGINPFVFGAEYKGSVAWITGIPASDIPLFIEQLSLVKRYLETNWNELFYPGRASTRHGMPSEDAITAINATKVEMTSIKSLAAILERTIQILKLWEFLLQEGLSQILDYVSRAFSKETLMQVTFPDLLNSPTGSSILQGIIKAIHQRYIDEGTDTESILRISSTIQELCPKLFDADDAVTMKVLTLINQAKASGDNTEALSILDSALNSIRGSATIMGLQEILDRLRECEFYEAMVELCCLAALQSDPQNYAIRFIVNNESQSDTLGKIAMERRQKYYFIIAKVLSDLDVLASGSSGSSSGTQQRKPAEMRRKLEYILDWIYTQSNDVLLHFSVFEWCFSMQLDQYAMASGSPYLKDYLFRKLASFPPADVEGIVRFLKLVADCCERSGDKWTAAKALFQLAVHETARIPITERVDYLLKIDFLCQPMEIQNSLPDLSEFLITVRTHRTLASVQKDIYLHVDGKDFDVAVTPDAMNRVMYELLDVNKLFQLVTEINMPQWTLVILGICGEPPNSRLIVHTWGKFFQNAIEFGERRQISRDALIALITEEIIRVRSHLSNSDQYCTLESVLEGFEKKYASTRRSLEDPVFVFDCIHQGLGQSIMDIIDVYHKLFGRYTADIVMSPHLLRVHIFIVNNVMGNTLSRSLPKDKRKVILGHYSRCLDSYLKVAMRLQLADENILIELQQTCKAVSDWMN